MGKTSMMAVAFAAGSVTIAQQSQGSDANLTSFNHSSNILLIGLYLSSDFFHVDTRNQVVAHTVFAL